MTFYTTTTRDARRVNPPFSLGRHHRANFARQAVIAAFGWRHARALDQADFVDRMPDQAGCRHSDAVGALALERLEEAFRAPLA